jgi:DNA polymerase-3 subunit chi
VTRIDFYILPDVALSALNRFACRLASKAVSSGHSVLMHTANETAGRELDELLWHYPDRRFLPHAVMHGDDPGGVPVLIGWEPPERYDGVLINLTSDVPEFFARFQRVAEIVVQEARDQGRDRYRFYRRRGYPLYDHDMDDWEAGQGT